MKRGLVVFVLVIILLVSVIANSEVSKEIPNENTESQSSPESSVDISTSDTSSSDISDSATSSDSQIPASDVVSDSNSDGQNTIVEDTNSGNNEEGNSNDNSGNNNEEKITICHKPGTPAEKTLEIPSSALDGHLGHGDYVGECEGNNNEDTDANSSEDLGDITENTATNVESDSSGNSQHDYVNIPHEPSSNNQAVNNNPLINNNQNIVDNNEIPTEQNIPIGLNSITGNIVLDIQEVIICHKPNTPAEQTMIIPSSALNGHLGHGDYAGFCDDINFEADAGYDQAVNERENVRFYGSSGIPDNLGLPIDYIWNFGDGKIAEGVNLKNPVHVYDKEGVYYVKLIVMVNNYVSEDTLAVDVSDVDN